MSERDFFGESAAEERVILKTKIGIMIDRSIAKADADRGLFRWFRDTRLMNLFSPPENQICAESKPFIEKKFVFKGETMKVFEEVE